MKLHGDISPQEISRFQYNHQRYIARPVLALSEYALRVTLQKLDRSPYFAIITDLSSDRANHENMILFVRYWDAEQSAAVTTYLCCLHLIGKDGASMATAIRTVCNVLSIDLTRKLIAICADGDSAMQGHKTGLVGQLRSDCDHVFTTHCAAHRQVLAVRDGVNVGDIMSLVDLLISSVYDAFNQRPKRFQFWELYARKHGVTAVKFQLYNSTRWWSREAAVKQLIGCLGPLTSHLYVVSRPSSSMYWPSAVSVLELLKRPLVLVSLHFVADLLTVLKVSRKLFEGTDFPIMQVHAEVQGACDSLEAFAAERSAAVCIDELKGENMQSLLKATNCFQPTTSGKVVIHYSSNEHQFSAALNDEHLPPDILEQLAEIPRAAARCLQARFPCGESDLLSLLRAVDFRTYIGRTLHTLNVSHDGVSDVRALVKMLNKKRHDVTGSQFWSNLPYIDGDDTEQVCLLNGTVQTCITPCKVVLLQYFSFHVVLPLMQVVSEFRAFRLEACKHGGQYKQNPGQFWEMLLGQEAAGFEGSDGAPSKFESMFKLYLLSVLIPTSSTDVERAFSTHKMILGVNRTRLQVKNIDSRLRGVEQVKPMLQQYGYRWAGLPETTDPGFLHPYQLYFDLAKEANLSSFLSIALHSAVAPVNSQAWLELYENEFEGVHSEEGVLMPVHANDLESDFTPAEMAAEVDRMTALLARGLDG